ncbi:MAG: hypothetical protein WCT14_01825 [Treponemataceae bacterium]
MKKYLVILTILVTLPLAAFADFGVGGAAFFKSPVLLGQPINTDNLNVNQFSFGADARLKVKWFQAEALLLYSAGSFNSLNAYLDAGVSLDMEIIRFSVGAGPCFTGNLGQNPPLQIGFNAKIGADLVLGNISVGLSYLMALNINNGIDVNTSSGLLGASVLFWL